MAKGNENGAVDAELAELRAKFFVLLVDLLGGASAGLAIALASQETLYTEDGLLGLIFLPPFCAIGTVALTAIWRGFRGRWSYPGEPLLDVFARAFLLGTTLLVAAYRLGLLDFLGTVFKAIGI